MQFKALRLSPALILALFLGVFCSPSTPGWRTFTCGLATCSHWPSSTSGAAAVRFTPQA